VLKTTGTKIIDKEIERKREILGSGMRGDINSRP